MSGGTKLQWSTALPRLQTHVSSSSLGEFKRCRRKYYYAYVLRLVAAEANVHLVFGSLIHEGLARYELLRAQGSDHESALRATLLAAAKRTWNKKLNRPWQSPSTSKNRDGLLRTLCWYLDHYAKVENVSTVVLVSGGPAVELKLEVDTGFVSQVTGEAIKFVGTLDRIVRFNDNKYAMDAKTTGRGVGAHQVAQFTPDNQFSLYTLMGQIALDEPISGMILDGIDVGVTYSSFARAIVTRTEGQLNEWVRDSHDYLADMSRCAEADYWPMNDKVCYGCEYREICSLDPKAREDTLKRLFAPRQDELQL